jgi:hypothetical protein
MSTIVHVKTERQFKKLLSMVEPCERYRYNPSHLKWAFASGFPYREISDDGIHLCGKGMSSDAIPVWAYCLAKMGKNAKTIVTDRARLLSALRSIGAMSCYRLIMRSRKDFVSLSSTEPGLFSYSRSASDRFNVARRVKTSFQKIMRRLGSEEPDHVLSDVAAKLFPLLSENNAVRLITGGEIGDFYYKHRLLLKSCMTERGAVEMYEINPDVCSLAVITKEKDGAVTGAARCMVFKSQSGKLYHSRVYYTHPEFSEAILSYMNKNGIDAAYERSPCDTVLMKVPDSGEVPYMDVFFYTDDAPDPGATCEWKSSPGDYTARCIDGTVDGYDRPRCDYCGETCYDTTYVRGLGDVCDECVSEQTFVCDRCYDRRSNDRMYTVSYHGQELQVCESCQNWYIEQIAKEKEAEEKSEEGAWCEAV